MLGHYTVLTNVSKPDAAYDREATGGPYGTEAVKVMVRFIASRKAPPADRITRMARRSI
jgi:hypothetical protein